MAGAEQLNHAKDLLRRAMAYGASAEDSLVAQRCTAAGDANHAGISAKDAFTTALTGAARKGKDHAEAAKELRTALGARADTPTAEKALRELIGAKGDVEYGTALLTATKAEPLVRRAQLLVDLAVQRVRLGG
jgi:hypothetical protein